MIRIFDAVLLAGTKLRSRKIRTSFTIIIAGLLFGLVAAIIVVSDGALGSAQRLMGDSVSGRYIVSGSSMTGAFDDQSAYYKDATLIEKAQAERKKLIEEKKLEAKRLGMPYDPASEPPVVQTIDGVQQLSGTPIATKLVAEAIASKHKSATFEDFSSLAKHNQATALYTARSLGAKDGQLQEMKDGQEKFGDAEKSMQQSNGSSPDINEQQLVSKALIANYIQPNNKWSPDSGRIPVVISQKRAAALTGFATPSKDASAKERLSYINDLRKKALGATFDVCYRNSVSLDRINQAMTIAKEIESRKNDKTYEKPALIYATPDSASCGAAIVSRDVRTKEEKDLLDKQLQFGRKFGEIVDPSQTKLTYEIVGIAPNTYADADMSYGLSLKDIVLSLFMASGFRMAIPEEMYSTMSNKEALSTVLVAQNDPGTTSMYSMGQNYYAEFANADAARSFINQQSCHFEMSGCMPVDKPFFITPFGSNSIALDDAKNAVSGAVFWITSVVTLIAAIIAGLTIGRTIADGRRETAVFRSIGFKRFDISQVYITYAILLCLFIALFAIVAGIAIAFAVNGALWLDTTLQAQLALGLYDSNQQFSYIGISPRLLIVVLASLAAGLIGMIIPMLRNVRRNPIRDMRDE